MRSILARPRSQPAPEYCPGNCWQRSVREPGLLRRTLFRAAALLAALLVAACQPMAAERSGLRPPGRPTRTLAVGPMAAPTRPHPQEEPLGPSSGAPTTHPDAATWLKWAGLGPYLSAPEDWSRIQATARSEGCVVLYSDTARSLNAVESFIQAYAGLEAETCALGGYDIYLRLVDDLQRSEHAADVYLVSDAPRTLGLLDQHLIWNYVPGDLTEVLPREMREPLLVHHWSAMTLIYNAALSQAAPIDNWWALTRPEWRGRVALPDPIANQRTMYLLITLTQHPDEMDAAYRAEFGHPPALDADCPNAGYQWIRDLLANEPILLHSDAEVASLVGDPEADEMYLGICGYEQYDKVSRGTLSFAPILQARPMAGIQWPTYLALVDRTQRPNAAKLLVRWLMGDEKGGQGYSAWYYPGYYPARTDVPDPKGAIPRQELEGRLWQPDAAYIQENLIAVRDHIAAYIGREVGGS